MTLPFDPEIVASELREYSEIMRAFDAVYRIILREHPNQWIAFNGKEVVCVAPSFESLFEGLEIEGIDKRRVHVHYMDPDPPTMILFNGGI